MNKFKEIRPVVLGLAIKDGKLLVSEGYDSKKDKTFYRCLGGGIEFLETSQEALKREFKEEIGADISVKDFLGISENIFTFEGKNGHEIIFLYNIELKDSDYKDEYSIIDEVNSKAKWINIQSFKNKEKIIYPTEILNYL
jgi:ADP-ribose pyrophosphatase YjhB (NUDIX family)